MGGPTQLGLESPEGLQCHRCPASFCSLPEGYYPPRARHLAWQGQPLHHYGGQQPSSAHNRWTLLLVQLDTQGQVMVAVKNCSPVELELQHNDFIGSIKNVQDCEAREVNLGLPPGCGPAKGGHTALWSVKCKEKTVLRSLSCKCPNSTNSNI